MNQFNKTFGLLIFKFEYKFENISWWTIMVFLAVLWFILLTNIRNLQVCKFWILTFIYWIHGHTHIQTCTNTCTHIIHTHTHSDIISIFFYPPNWVEAASAWRSFLSEQIMTNGSCRSVTYNSVSVFLMQFWVGIHKTS
jgi:hypothetical protein